MSKMNRKDYCIRFDYEVATKKQLQHCVKIMTAPDLLEGLAAIDPTEACAEMAREQHLFLTKYLPQCNLKGVCWPRRNINDADIDIRLAPSGKEAAIFLYDEGLLFMISAELKRQYGKKSL